MKQILIALLLTLSTHGSSFSRVDLKDSTCTVTFTIPLSGKSDSIINFLWNPANLSLITDQSMTITVLKATPDTQVIQYNSVFMSVKNTATFRRIRVEDNTITLNLLESKGNWSLIPHPIFSTGYYIITASSVGKSLHYSLHTNFDKPIGLLVKSFTRHVASKTSSKLEKIIISKGF